MPNTIPNENKPLDLDLERVPSDFSAGKAVVQLLGAAFVILGMFLAYLLLALWPDMPTDATGSHLSQIALFKFSENSGVVFTIKLDTQLVLLVMVAGATGSFVHIATSFSDYVGNGRLNTRWLWWYVLRPFIGMTLFGSRDDTLS